MRTPPILPERFAEGALQQRLLGARTEYNEVIASASEKLFMVLSVSAKRKNLSSTEREGYRIAAAPEVHGQPLSLRTQPATQVFCRLA